MTDDKRTILEDKWAAALDDDTTVPGDEAPDIVDAGEDAGVAGEPDPSAAEVAALKDQLLRQQAEMANYRRRTQQEGGERAERGRIEVLQRLLPVLDDFERALETDAEADGYREGVELILKSLRDLLTSFAVDRIDPHGEEFDPTLHDAVQQLPTEEVPAGRVASVYKPGYRIGERLLRPATVAVARPPSADSDPDS